MPITQRLRSARDLVDPAPRLRVSPTVAIPRRVHAYAVRHARRGARVRGAGGGGLNLLRGNGASDTGWDLFAGLESRRAIVHPYVEARWLFHNGNAFQANAGLNFTLF